MKLPAPRVIALDDVKTDLDELANALNRHGVACIPIHFQEDQDPQAPECPAVRVIFADLHLIPSLGENSRQHFSVIGNLIEEKIRPSGPYIIILWTRYPSQASALFEFLNERLENVTKPLSVTPLDKHTFLTEDKLNDVDGLIKEVNQLVRKQAQVAALLNWEERVLDASTRTVSSILMLARNTTGATKIAEKLGQILNNLAEAAVGKQNVRMDRFRAVNDALIPILSDRLTTMIPIESDEELWRSALEVKGTSQGSSTYEAARLQSAVTLCYIS